MQATLNFVSEYGFLCKPKTVATAATRHHIEVDLESDGFYPLDNSPANPFPEGILTFPAIITNASYQAVDPQYASANPSGYCLSVNG